MNELTIADLRNFVGTTEPLIHDLKVAEALGFDRPRKIRGLIIRNIKELGAVRPTVGQTSRKGGRRRTEYWLGGCIDRRTDNAEAVPE